MSHQPRESYDHQPGHRPSSAKPLVSIGIPAFNRPLELERAVRSATAQDHAHIEILVSDDASPDPRVAEIASRLQQEDDRITFVRQPENLGHDRNYQWVLEAARGDYFMWLSDDDWIDPAYVSSCVSVLRSEPGTVLVAGQTRGYRDGRHVVTERPTNLTSGRMGLRLISYFAWVSLNGVLFGVARRKDLVDVGFPSVVGGDWLLVASLAARGRIRTLTDVNIHRSLMGLGSDPQGLAESFGMQGVAARHHHVVVAWRVFTGILHGRITGRLAGRSTRLTVGTVAAVEILLRFPGLTLLRALIGDSSAGRIEAIAARRLWTESGGMHGDSSGS